MNRSSSTRGILLLSLATFIWGTTFVVTKQTLNSIPASHIIFARFLIAAVVFLPFLRPGRKLWLASLELGTLLFLGFATQTVGLQYTTVNRSAFITSLHVIFVPVIANLAGRRSRPTIWFAATLALIGVFLLTNDGSSPNAGDRWTLVCAICWAIYIIRIETFTRIFSPTYLTAAHLWVVVALSAAWALIAANYGTRTNFHPLTQSPPHSLSSTPIAIPWQPLLYLGLAATAATTWLQTRGQKSVTAPQAAVLYTLEPVWAAFFAWLILHESPGPRSWCGAIIILIAAVLTQLPAPSPRTQST